jgi:hypothetical protein
MIFVSVLVLTIPEDFCAFFSIFHPVCLIFVVDYIRSFLNKFLKFVVFPLTYFVVSFSLLATCTISSWISLVSLARNCFFKMIYEYWIEWPLKVHLKVSQTWRGFAEPILYWKNSVINYFVLVNIVMADFLLLAWRGVARFRTNTQRGKCPWRF